MKVYRIKKGKIAEELGQEEVDRAAAARPGPSK
jgi:hypothetical protein